MIVLLAFLLGFVVAAVPLGPLTLMYYRYAVVEDWRSAGMLGAVGGVADGVYTWLAMHGYAWLAGLHPAVLFGVRALGVLLVGGLGFRYAIAPPVSPEADGERLPGVAVQGLVLAFFNPSALVTWVVAIDVLRTTFGLAPFGPADRVLVPIAVGSGAGLWFLGLLAVWRKLGWVPPLHRARAFVRAVGVALVLTAVGYALRGFRPLM